MILMITILNLILQCLLAFKTKSIFYCLLREGFLNDDDFFLVSRNLFVKRHTAESIPPVTESMQHLLNL